MTSLPNAEYRGLDPELPSIAALAAAEVDELLHERPTQVSHLRKLSRLLANSFELNPLERGPRHFLDPISTNVVVSTLRDASSTRLSSYDELAKVSLELANQMKDASSAANRHLLIDLKRFCLALSKHALASSGTSDQTASISDHKR
jgi:hypothetical protein